MQEITTHDLRRVYRAAELTQNRRYHPAYTPPGSFLRLTGVDGRFVGEFRRFPGFSHVTDLADGTGPGLFMYNGVDVMPDHGLSGAITTVYFFKHVTVRVPPGIDPTTKEPLANSRERVFRGFVVAHDYNDFSSGTPTQRGVLRFVYYDKEASAWKSVTLLQERSVLDDTGDDEQRFLINASSNFASGGPIFSANMKIDACAMGPFLYFCVGRATPAGQNGPNYTGDPLTTENNTYPKDNYNRSVRFSSTGVSTIAVHFTEFGPLLNPTHSTSAPGAQTGAGKILQGKARIWLRTFSALKNVRGPLIYRNDVDAAGTLSYFQIVDGSNGWPDLIARGVDDDSLESRLRLYRTLDSYYFETSGVGTGLELIGGKIFEEREVQVVSTIPGSINSAGYDRSGNGSGGYVNLAWGYQVSETALATSRAINLDRDDTAYAPRSLKLLLPYQGTLLRVGTQPIGPPPIVNVERSEMLSWGSLLRYAPEECRIQDATPLGDGYDENILSLVQAGDFAFANGDTSIYRIHRAGRVLAINTIESLAGGTGRYGALGVGSSEFVVTPTGLAMVSGQDGTFDMVTALDRVIQQDWAGTLASVHLGYDVRLGAMFMLNDDRDEAVLIWANTGAITTLEGMTFKHCTQGVNPLDAGFHRSFWITAAGRIVTPNAERSEVGQYLTMLGMDNIRSGKPNYRKVFTSIHPIVNPVDRTVIHLSPNTAEPSNIEIGAVVRFIGGQNDGLSRIVVGTGSDPSGGFIQVDEAVPNLIWTDDIITVDAVLMEIVGWPYQHESEGIDPMLRASLLSMGHNMRMFSGSALEEEEYLRLTHRVYGYEDLTTPIVAAQAKVSEHLRETFSAIEDGANGEVLIPAWRCEISDLDVSLLAGEVNGKMYRTVGASAPSGD